MAANRSSLYYGGHIAGQRGHLEVAVEPRSDDEVCTLLPYEISTLTTITQSCESGFLKLTTSDFSTDQVGLALLGQGGDLMQGLV